jgi:gamma-glutamyltranspeptidase/glutathione hydrolase
MAATSQPLASAAALRVLQDGGNAVDAAIAAAAVLNVVEPMMTGIGGDMFALVFMQKEGKPVALNGSGWAGSKATLDFFKSRNMSSAPGDGMQSVSVPGAVAGWYKLHQKYGKLPMSRLLQPAIDYADNGFPVSEIIAGQWREGEFRLRQTPDAARTLLIDGRAPRHGEIFRMPELARTLRLIARGGRDVFYKGEIAAKILAFSGILR